MEMMTKMSVEQQEHALMLLDKYGHEEAMKYIGRFSSRSTKTIVRMQRAEWVEARKRMLACRGL